MFLYSTLVYPIAHKRITVVYAAQLEGLFPVPKQRSEIKMTSVRIRPPVPFNGCNSEDRVLDYGYAGSNPAPALGGMAEW